MDLQHLHGHFTIWNYEVMHGSQTHVHDWSVFLCKICKGNMWGLAHVKQSSNNGPIGWSWGSRCLQVGNEPCEVQYQAHNPHNKQPKTNDLKLHVWAQNGVEENTLQLVSQRWVMRKSLYLWCHLNTCEPRKRQEVRCGVIQLGLDIQNLIGPLLLLKCLR